MLPIFIIIVLGFILAWMYNSLIARKNDVLRSYATTEVILRKRYDLIPNLVETLKQYMGYESGLLNEVTELRSRAMGSTTASDEKLKVDSLLAQKLQNLMVVAENYPELKANQSFAMIQGSWKELEDQLQFARTAYNDSVTRFNNTVEMFPTNIMASMMEYKTKKLFEVMAGEQENVKAEELFSKNK